MALTPELHQAFQELFAGFKVKNSPKVYLSKDIGQPFVWGLFRGSIYLPMDSIPLDGAQHCRTVVAHELSHIARFDAGVNMLQVLAQAVFWFHPLVWWANRRIRQEREKCCDEMAVAQLSMPPEHYTGAIVEILAAERRSAHPVPSLAIVGSLRDIEERIRTMMRPGRNFHKHPSVIAATIVLLLAIVAVPTTLVLTARAATEVEAKQGGQARLRAVQQSFDKQRAMFRNMRFKVEWLQRDRILNILEYQIDVDGRYLMSLAQYETVPASGEIESQRHSAKYSFNGETYRAFYSEEQASIFTPEQNYDNGRPLIKPTHFMDHMFNESVDYILEHPERAELSETGQGLWILKYEDDKSQFVYEATLDPKQDFMIVELKRTSKEGHVYLKKVEYKTTSEGFQYPIKGQRSFNGKNGLTMNITEFKLNIAGSNYTLEFPKGTHVRDYTRRTNPPETYRYNEPNKDYTEIVGSAGKFVAGVTVDKNGKPVPGVSVQVCCHKEPRGGGRFSFTFSNSFDVLNAVTNRQGRFAIELEEDGEYNLRFSPAKHAAIIAYDVPVGKRDLTVTLSEGGTVTGQLLRMEGGKKVPIGSAEVKIEQSSQGSYSHLGFGRSQKIITDSQGRFRFDRLRTKMRDIGSRHSEQWNYSPRAWEISYDTTSKTVVFYEGTKIEDVELLVEPDYTNPASLVGKPLPDFENIATEFESRQVQEKMLLVCFFDMQQRPARRCVMQLAQQTEQLRQKGVVVVVIQALSVGQNKLDEWIKESKISFPVGTTKGDAAETRFAWGVKSLPWLNLTDRGHKVTHEGITLQQLEALLN